MIHIENINITVNAQALSDEAETTHTLDFELLKARIDSLFTKDEDAEEAKDAEPENQEEVQPPINAARMESLQQQSDAWHAVCKVLFEVCPYWCSGTGSAREQAVAAIRAMAEAFYRADQDSACFAGSITINGVTYIVAPHEEGQPLVAEAKAKKEGKKK